jgi:hypothetical protein
MRNAPAFVVRGLTGVCLYEGLEAIVEDEGKRDAKGHEQLAGENGVNFADETARSRFRAAREVRQL